MTFAAALRRLGAVGAFGAISTLAAPALANGRFPESNQIQFFAHDPNLVLLRVTFGLLVSHDRGKTFDWVCEQSIGFSGVEDPMYTVSPSNTLVATTFQGLTVSRDLACSFEYAGGDLTSQVFIDLTANPRDMKNVFVFASAYDRQNDAGQILFASKVWESTDDAKTFQLLGSPLDPSLLGYTIDVAPTDRDRLYLTAIRDPGAKPKGVLLVSKDRGQTWQETAVPLEGEERSLYVAAVDPKNEDRVYIRTHNNSDKAARLILSEATDGGPPTLKTVYTSKAPLTAFALTPDGGRVYIGGQRDGILTASTTDFKFEQRSNIEAGCLGISDEGLWACSTERSGFVAGVSKDDGRTFEARVNFCTIRGPLGCPAGSSTASKCASAWPALRASLGCNATTTDAGVGTSGQNGPVTPLSANGSSCSSQSSAASPWGVAAGALAAIAVFVRARRRDRR